jgi:hypothetical protein
MVRTFMGEMKRHLKLCRWLFVESSKTTRQRFIDYLEAARKAGFARNNLDATTAADALSGMLMSGTLRRPLTESIYSGQRYFDTCLDLFLKGIER